MNKWQKQRQSYLDRLEKQYERELVKQYQVALKELRSKLDNLYKKIGDNPDEFFTQAQKYNRLAKLEKDIAKEIGKLTGKTAKTLDKSQRHMYEESYYFTAYVLSNMVQADLGYSVLNQNLIKEAIQNPLDRVGFLQRNRDNQQRLARQLREQLTQGLIQGESYHKTSKRIKERMDVGAYHAMRIAQTENHRTRSAGRLASLEEGQERGLDLKKQWLATVDGNTRDSHQELDGKTIDLDKNFEGEEGSGPAPGMLGSASEDINCRCDLIEIVDGFTPNTRRVRGVGVTEYKTYNEFKKEGLITE